jgi:PleD family two-component response regulator
VSIGATAVNAFDAFATALNRADRALFQAKQSGRNAVKVASVNG